MAVKPKYEMVCLYPSEKKCQRSYCEGCPFLGLKVRKEAVDNAR